MKKNLQPLVINSVSALHRLLSLPKPAHPLVSFMRLDDIAENCRFTPGTFIYNFYSICIKTKFDGKMKYGQNYYDFDEGVMTFTSPGQVLATETAGDMALEGWWLIVHPDFLQGYPLASAISKYGYFSYAANEALHLSDKEQSMIETIMQNIQTEYLSTIDNFSQDVIITQIDLLLTYCNRFYNRQFITRKNASNELLSRLEALLTNYFLSEKVKELGLPTVQYLSGALNISSHYLSDMLRNLTGQSTQHYIHDKLIEKAKEVLTTTSFSIGEIAYQLGFEHPQSFSKLFKQKTSLTPLEFRQSFN